MHGILLMLTSYGFCSRSNLSLRMSLGTNSVHLSSRSLLLLVEFQLLDNSPKFSSGILETSSSDERTSLLDLQVPNHQRF